MLPAVMASVLGQRFLPHIADICGGFAKVAAKLHPLTPVLMLLWRRLRNTLATLDRMAARSRQGRLRAPRKRTGERKPRATERIRTSQAHAWLIRLHQPLAQWAPRVEFLLNDPELVALCTAAPQAGRLLRPWCRAFGLTPPPHIARPAAPRKPRPKKPKKPKPPPFAEHAPSQWPHVPHRLRLRVPGLPRPGSQPGSQPGSRRRKPSA